MNYHLIKCEVSIVVWLNINEFIIWMNYFLRLLIQCGGNSEFPYHRITEFSFKILTVPINCVSGKNLTNEFRNFMVNGTVRWSLSLDIISKNYFMIQTVVYSYLISMIIMFKWNLFICFTNPCIVIHHNRTYNCI